MSDTVTVAWFKTCTGKCYSIIIVRKLSSLQRLFRTASANWQI